MIYKRSEWVDPRLKYTAEEISQYNADAYFKFPHPIYLVENKDKWVPPIIITKEK